jgi:hypothetical protein
MTGPLVAVLMLVQFDSVPTPRPLMAIGQTIAINTFVNRVDAWVFGQDWARSGTRAWGKNLRLGWEWDEDAFPTNMFAHPYHGALYFNAARSNGLDYFRSVPVAFFGSWSWENFGETYRPSLNDWFMTSFGGIALGEVFHRVGATIRDNRARGGARIRRELAALPMDPIGGLNRLLRGQWKAIGPNPPEHDPGDYVLRLGGGLRMNKGWISDSGVTSMGAFVVDLFYGDPFTQEYRQPFDVFGARLILTSGSGSFNALRASGRLYQTNLNGATARMRHVLSVNQRYDYIKNPAQSIGGQSVEVGVNSRLRLGTKGYGLRSSVFGDFVILGAIDAPETGLGERNYDFGPGVGGRWELALDRHGARFLRLFAQAEHLWAVSGASADHSVNFGGFELNVPIVRGIAAAWHSTVFARSSYYHDGSPRDKRDYREMRFLLMWTQAGFGP